MDRKRMDADGGRVVHRDRRASKLAVVVAVQNVLVAACLVVTLYVYRDVQGRKITSGENIHIQFEPIADITGNGKLKFDHIHSSNMMSLVGNNDTIYVNCTGPYILYVDVCYRSMETWDSRGMLQLQVAGRETPVSSFTLNTGHDNCTGLNSVAYLKVRDKASLYLYSNTSFKVKKITVGLSYLLGRVCEY